jgi:DNA invertase Pin-like site-specific DNA recombinase
MQVIAYIFQEFLIEPQSALESMGYTIDQVYIDRAIPSSPDYRPELGRLMAQNQIDPADLLLVESLDALGNTLQEVATLIATLEEVGTTVVSLNDDQPGHSPQVEQRSNAQPTRAALLRLAGEVQNCQRRRRLRAGHGRNRLKALPPPGKAPYGYRRGQERYLIDRAAAPVVTAFVEEFLLYGSLRGAVRFVERKFGKRISVSTGRRWLTHPVYRGDLQYGDGQVLRDTHAAIISRDAAAQIDRLLRRNSQLPPRTAGALRSLAGLVSCQACGTRLAISTTTLYKQNKVYLYLRPTDCPRQPKCKSIPYEAALQRIIHQICRDLPEAVGSLQVATEALQEFPGAIVSPPSPSWFQAQIDQKEAVLAQLPTLVETGVLDQETADLRQYNLRSEIAEIQQQISQLPPVNLQELSQAVAIPQFWLDLSESERRFFFREFIQDVQIVRQGEHWEVELAFVFDKNKFKKQ